MSGKIPEHLVPIALRLGRVDELSMDLATVCFRFVQSDPLHLKQRKTEATWELVVDSIAPVPPVVGLIFSDAVNQLRSSLDNALMVALEIGRSAPLSVEEERAAQFLIYDDEGQYRDALKRLVRRLPELSVDEPLGRRMFEMQPFQPLERIRQMKVRSEHVEHGGHHLAILQAYSNADKHRRPHVFALGSAAIGSMGGVTRFSVEPVTDLKPGQVLAQLPSSGLDLVEVWPFVAVRRPLVDELVPPGAELHELHRFVAEVAVPKLLDVAHVALPPHIDLRVLDWTDAERVAAGGGTYAHERAGKMFRDEVIKNEPSIQVAETVVDGEASGYNSDA